MEPVDVISGDNIERKKDEIFVYHNPWLFSQENQKIANI